MKKIFDSDWLRTVHFKCKYQGTFNMISFKMMTKIFCAKTGKNFFLNEKKWRQERSSSTSALQIFSCLYH